MTLTFLRDQSNHCCRCYLLSNLHQSAKNTKQVFFSFQNKILYCLSGFVKSLPKIIKKIAIWIVFRHITSCSKQKANCFNYVGQFRLKLTKILGHEDLYKTIFLSSNAFFASKLCRTLTDSLLTINFLNGTIVKTKKILYRLFFPPLQCIASIDLIVKATFLHLDWSSDQLWHMRQKQFESDKNVKVDFSVVLP